MERILVNSRTDKVLPTNTRYFFGSANIGRERTKDIVPQISREPIFLRVGSDLLPLQNNHRLAEAFLTGEEVLGVALHHS